MIRDEITKNRIKQIVGERDTVALLSLFDEDPDQVRRYLTRLSFSPGDEFHAKTIEAFQFLANERGDAMQEFFFETIRRHMWNMNDEGGNIDWSAPEIIGAIIAGNPVLFGQYFSFAYCAAADELMYQPSLVRAYDRVKNVDPSLVSSFEYQIEALREQLSQEGRL